MSKQIHEGPRKRNVGPRLANGRFVSATCPDCGYGTLRPDGPNWACDGLIDPQNDALELQPCERGIVDGVLYPHAGLNAEPSERHNAST